jgi:hypothetical protein
MSRRIVLLSLALFAIAPAAAAQAAPFSDRVLDVTPSHSLKAKAAQATATNTIQVPTAEGYSIPVSFTSEVPPDPALAASYVAYLDSLPHGTELAKLTVLIAGPDQVDTLCGGQDGDGILGCYGGTNEQMIVPSTGLDTTTADGLYSVRYVITHEYGHHIAANRSNDLYGATAIDMGPKYWSSYELVCDQSIEKKLFPGYEGNDLEEYHANPGEDWAEVYARLTFPAQPWDFSPLLGPPDATALDAARRDVLTPWTKNTSKTFTMPSGRDREAFDLPLTLDGKLSATVTGPKGSTVAVAITSGRQKVGKSKGTGARGTWKLSSGCREKPTETLTFLTTRKAGKNGRGANGAVTLKVSYPG